MSNEYVRSAGAKACTMGNDSFSLEVAWEGAGAPFIRSLRREGSKDLQWAAPSVPLAPTLTVNGTTLAGGALAFERFEPVGSRELRMHFRTPSGLAVIQHLAPSPDMPVWKSWVTLVNNGTSPAEGITRFDAVNTAFAASDGEQQAGYVLGWMEGPRADAPGRPALPSRKYGGWIPKFLYGEGALIPPDPEGGWAAPVYRLVQERLLGLPLRSGKRSTYVNQPWVMVIDPQRSSGWFLGFEWSGTWAIDAAHDPEKGCVTVSARSDGCTHVLASGQSLVSPAAFCGIFAGGWDDGFNLCRRYTDGELIPKIADPWPTSLHVWTFHSIPEKRTVAFMNKELDAVAAAGIETSYVETIWWDEGADIGEFSHGLGNFGDSVAKFPYRLRGLSDAMHARGMKFGLWFEIERVDIRTANRLRNPWKPEWIMHQKGYPYRSWCQHAYMLCLGVPEARAWALENLIWAVKEYAVDYVMFDSNEWAVCDDRSHGHGAGDGEWAQIQGYLEVMRGLREEFPNLMIMNSSGGSQRADFGIARVSNCVHPHDNSLSSAKQRRYQHGTGCMYPNSYQANYLGVYSDVPTADGFGPMPAGRMLSDERFEWRVLNRLLGFFAIGLEVSALPPSQQNILKKAAAFYKRIRHLTHANRYVLAGPRVLYEPVYEEADNWEAYQYVSKGGDDSALYLYRCLSPDADFTVRLRGLDAQATYRAESYGGRYDRETTGAELMEKGVTLRLDRTRSAEIIHFTRRSR